jgi:hypothetical protein
MSQLETPLQREIMVELSKDGHFVARYNVGLFLTQDLRPISIGVKGYADLFGHRAGDAKAFYLEVKKPKGSRRSPEQKKFIAAMKERGAIAAFVTSVKEARAALAA